MRSSEIRISIVVKRHQPGAVLKPLFKLDQAIWRIDSIGRNAAGPALPRIAGFACAAARLLSK